MKLGEALKLRSDTQRRLEELRVRAAASAQVQEGSAPPDDPNELLAQIEQLNAQVVSLIQRINRTNVNTALQSGATIADALAVRDQKLVLRTALQSVAKAASEPQQRFLRSEIRVIRTVDAAALLRRADELAKEHRELDALIQETNWTVELTG
jgi:hypothetical protein